MPFRCENFFHTFSSLIQTMEERINAFPTVGIGITPILRHNKKLRARGLLPPVGNFTLPRRHHYSVYISIAYKSQLVNKNIIYYFAIIF